MSSNVYFTFTSIILLGSIFSLFSLIDDCIILKRLLVKNILVILNILFIDFFLISFLDYIVKLEFLNKF